MPSDTDLPSSWETKAQPVGHNVSPNIVAFYVCYVKYTYTYWDHWFEAKVPYPQPRSMFPLAVKSFEKIGSTFSYQEIAYKHLNFSFFLEKQKKEYLFYMYAISTFHPRNNLMGQNSVLGKLHLFILPVHPRWSFKCISTVSRHLRGNPSPIPR